LLSAASIAPALGRTAATPVLATNDTGAQSVAPTVVEVEPSVNVVEAVAEREAAHNAILGLEPDAWVAIFTGTLMLSTILMWRDTRRSANAALKAANVAEMTLVATQRPYLSVGGEHRLTQDDSGAVTGIEFWFVIKNKGNTPALRTLPGGGLQVIPHADPRGLDFDRLCDEGTPLGEPAIVPTGSEVDTATIALDVRRATEVLENRADLWVGGWIEYDDVIPDTPRHGLEWCTKVYIDGVLLPGKERVRYQVWGDHNRHYDCPPEKARR
jgi:hypothetical protein